MQAATPYLEQHRRRECVQVLHVEGNGHLHAATLEDNRYTPPDAAVDDLLQLQKGSAIPLGAPPSTQAEAATSAAAAATAAAVGGGPQEAAGGGAAVAVAMAWRAADVASSAQLAQCAGWMRAVSDTLSVRAMQVCQLLAQIGRAHV